MKEEENITEYFERIDEIVNEIQGIGDDMEEREIVEKVLRSLLLSTNWTPAAKI